MSIFEYPYVIVTILAAVVLLMGLIALYFTMKSARAAKGSPEKSFCGIGKIENELEKAGALRKNRCLIYIFLSLDGMRRSYPESKVMRLYDQVKRVLFTRFCLQIDGQIAFYGEDSFVAFNYLSEEEATSRIEKSAEEINEVLVKHGAVGMVRIHFGYCLTSATEVSFKTVLGRAKQACRMAEDGAVLCCRWDNTSAKAFEHKINIENNIQSQIDNNRFFLEYQPILDAKTGKIGGAEVLSRLNSPTEGVLTPSMFLFAVNNVGLNQKFDYYIFEKNCKWISSDKENRMKHMYTINFSRYTLCDHNFAERIMGIVEKYGIDYGCIAVEILEDKSVEGEEKTAMVRNLKVLKEKGFSVLLDDFGKGHTSFDDLTELDISIVKIDKSITQNTDNEKGFLVLKNIIRTAHDLGIRTLCEGVETQEQKIMAEKAGCDMLQGYYFYRPMPVTQLEALLEQQ